VLTNDTELKKNESSVEEMGAPLTPKKFIIINLKSKEKILYWKNFKTIFLRKN
jgi:hypothetical protein